MSTPFVALQEALDSLNAVSSDLGSSMSSGLTVRPDLLALVLTAQKSLADALDVAAAEMAACNASERSLLPGQADGYRRATQTFAAIYVSHKLQGLTGPEGVERPFAELFAEVQQAYTKRD